MVRDGTVKSPRDACAPQNYAGSSCGVVDTKIAEEHGDLAKRRYARYLKGGVSHMPRFCSSIPLCLRRAVLCNGPLPMARFPHSSCRLLWQDDGSQLIRRATENPTPLEEHRAEARMTRIPCLRMVKARARPSSMAPLPDLPCRERAASTATCPWG